MEKSNFSDSQIIGILKQAESGIPVPEICRENGISSARFTLGVRSTEGWMPQ